MKVLTQVRRGTVSGRDFQVISGMNLMPQNQKTEAEQCQ